MFEYLAPPRRVAAAPGAAPHRPMPPGGAQPKPATDVGYRDRVF